jgi:hypothetical protein
MGPDSEVETVSSVQEESDSGAKPERRVVKGFTDIPAPASRTFEFTQNGQEFAVEFFPLTGEEVEAVRNSLPEPEAPDKPIRTSAQDIAYLKAKGFPTTFRDVHDPEYQAARKRREQDLTLETVRAAMRWGAAPWQFTIGPGVDGVPEELRRIRDEFRTEIRKRLTAGNLDKLVNAVVQATFSIRGDLIEDFFGPSVQ